MKLKRKDERRIVLEALYAWEMYPKSVNELLTDVADLKELHFDVTPYITKSLKSVINNREMLDEIIVKYLTDWEFNRVAPMDITLLRIALSEMMFFSDIPAQVTINEIVELSKTYSNHNAPKFINGILDHALRDLKKDGKIKKNNLKEE